VRGFSFDEMNDSQRNPTKGQRPLEWMRFDPVEFGLLCDGLTFAQVGALTKVMLHLWQRGPLSDGDFRRIAKGEADAILDLLTPHGDGMSLDMVERARTYGEGRRTQRVEAGKASAQKRNDRSTTVQRTANDRSTDVLSMSVSESLSNSNSKSISNSNSEKRARSVQPDMVAPDAYADEWNEWLCHRREIKKPMTLRSQRAQLSAFDGWTVDRIKAAISHSIANGWQGIFEPKQNTNGQPTGQVRPEQLSVAEKARLAIQANAEHHARMRDAGPSYWDQ
jgi:hypothetical protein